MTKFLCWAVLVSISVAFITGVMEASMYAETSDGLYSLSGLGMVVFGPWLSIRVLMTLK